MKKKPRFMVLPGGVQAADQQQAEMLRMARFGQALDGFVSNYVRTREQTLTLQDTVTTLLALASGLAFIAGGDAEQFTEAARFIFEREEAVRKKAPPPGPEVV